MRILWNFAGYNGKIKIKRVAHDGLQLTDMAIFLVVKSRRRVYNYLYNCPRSGEDMAYKVYVDGQEGTTGLRIHEYLSGRTDLEILHIPFEQRKDLESRRHFLNTADLVFLCLPDQASKEAVALITNKKARVIDASTAHRTVWTYGFPELNKSQRDLIRSSRRVSVPGCHATGFMAAVYPIVQAGIVSREAGITCQSITGYSGGGKSLIQKFEQYEARKASVPKPYALKLQHKHLPEMQKIPNLSQPPVFLPVVADFYKGMAVSVPVTIPMLRKAVKAEDLVKFYQDYYADEKYIRVLPYGVEDSFEDGFFDVEGCNDTNRLDIFVFGHEGQMLVIARLDNLGKGASGAAIQNMNIMLGLDEGIGLQAG